MSRHENSETEKSKSNDDSSHDEEKIENLPKKV